MTRNDVFEIRITTIDGWVFIKTIEGKVIPCKFLEEEIEKARSITRFNGVIAGVDEFVRLYNEKYLNK